jgi:hypothetical protein
MRRTRIAGPLTLASRENLDNLTWVINCNLQRLDGPVRGNGKIIQELEAAFRGAGWNVIKVVWGADWDALLDRDENGKLVKRMGEVVDGQYQKYTVSDGEYIRRHFFGVDPELLQMVEHLSDETLETIRRGGHDPGKVYAAYHSAVSHKGAPTVILAKTVKGYGLGEAGEGRNVAHNQKKVPLTGLKDFRTRFNLPISDSEIESLPFYKPETDSPEIKYLQQRRELWEATSLNGTSALNDWMFPHCRTKSSAQSHCSREVMVLKVPPPLPSELSSAVWWPSSPSARAWSPLSPTKLARSAWKDCSLKLAFTAARGSSTNRSTPAAPCSTRKPATANCLKKASTKPAPWAPLSPPGPHTPTSA